MATSVTYNLTGAVEFPFPYNVRTKDELVLSLSVGGVVPPASYDVVGMGPNSPQVTVIYPGAPADGAQTLTISRGVLVSKVSDFTSDRAVTAAALNAEFDNIYRIITDNTLSLGLDAAVESASASAAVLNEYLGTIATANMTFPLDLGQITDPVLYNKFDLGGL